MDRISKILKTSEDNEFSRILNDIQNDLPPALQRVLFVLSADADERVSVSHAELFIEIANHYAEYLYSISNKKVTILQLSELFGNEFRIPADSPDLNSAIRKRAIDAVNSRLVDTLS